VAAEIADLDPLLGDALSSVFDEWHSAFASLLERGKAAGWIHASIKPEVEAALFVSAFAGFTVTLRTSRNPAAREHFITGMEGYLETLRVPQD